MIMKVKFPILCGLLVWYCQAPVALSAEISATRQAELVNMVRQDCGSCHGMRLKGGLGPALLPESLREVPAENLQIRIMRGRPGTAMPPWQQFMNEDEAAWIVRQLQKGFPDVQHR